jgi:ABC-type sugar transport system ATPase subunit
MLTLEPNQYGIIAWPALHERAASALGQLGVSADTQQRLGEHGGVALTELIEIARSIVRGGSVFVFDESTAALGVEEIGNLLQRGSGANGRIWPAMIRPSCRRWAWAS